MVKEGVTMDYPNKDLGDSERKVTAILTSLVELLGHISNHTGSPINFSDAPVTKKPTSKKVDIDGKMDTDKSSLGNRALPGMAIPHKGKEFKKAINPYENNSRDFTGAILHKEDNVEPQEEIELLAPALLGARMLSDDEENIEYSDSAKKSFNAMSTSEGKELLATLEEAVKKLEKFLNTTKISGYKALRPKAPMSDAHARK